MSTIELRRRQNVMLPDARGTTLHITRGTVWITQEDDTRDIVLRPGEAWTIDRDGLTIVEAQGDTTMTTTGGAAVSGVPAWSRRLRALAKAWLSLTPRQPLPHV